MQRIAWIPAVFGLALMTGCQTTPAKPPPGPAHVMHAPPPRTGRPPYQRYQRPPIPRNTYYPPLEPLPPRRQPPRPTPAPATTAGPRSQISPSTISTSARLNVGKWQAIVVHHSATSNATPEGMDRYHRRDRGWKNGLGYHFVIGNGVNYPDGKIFVSERWKDQLSGAHCRNKDSGRFFGVWRPANFFNTNAIGICLIGDFQKSGPTWKQQQALEELVVLLCNEAHVSPAAVYGHGEVTGKTECPGSNMNTAQLRRQLAARFRGTAVYASHGSG